MMNASAVTQHAAGWSAPSKTTPSAGGFNSAVLESLETGDVKTPVEAIAWPDQFIEHGSESILRKKYGLTAEAALQKIITHLNS